MKLLYTAAILNEYIFARREIYFIRFFNQLKVNEKYDNDEVALAISHWVSIVKINRYFYLLSISTADILESSNVCVCVYLWEERERESSAFHMYARHEAEEN